MTGRAGMPDGGDRDGSGGFVLVAVLWILAALATLASIVAVSVSNTAVATRIREDRLVVEALVSAALEATAERLSASPPEERSRPGAFRLRLGQADLAIAFRPEAGRVDLNAAPKELLGSLFALLGARPEDSEAYSDRVVAWRRPVRAPGSGDEERAAYRAAGLPYGPREGPFQSPAELTLVLGLPPSLVRRAMPYVTVFSRRSAVDLLSAAPELAAALGERPAGPDPGAPNPASADGSLAVGVEMRLGLPNGRIVGAECVILIPQDGEAPFHVLSWRDDLDGAR